MPHVLFAAPSIGSFPLHDRLAELAMRRGHRVTVLAVGPTDRAFWLAQGLPVRALVERRGNAGDAVPLLREAGLPLRELGEVDCRLAGHPTPSARQRARAEHRLSLAAAGVAELLAHDTPDVVVMHQGRSGLHRAVHFLARRSGIGVVHLGDGLLPGTLQYDVEGVDGDSSLCRRAAVDYRGVRADPEFLRAALAAWLGGATAPSPLRRPPSPPLLFDRLHATACAAVRHGWRAGRAAFAAWRAALPTPAPAHAHPDVPSPAIAVLLQSDRCARVRLDAPPAANARALLQGTRAAVAALDAHLAVVGVLPSDACAEDRVAARELGCLLVPAAAVHSVLATALAVVTINHPLAGAALLHGTPVVHVGRSIYGVPGVAVASTLGALRDGLTTALEHDRPSLRERFLTRVLRRDHVWCASDSPDRNGLHGLMLAIERSLHERAPFGGRIAYRPGPAWPLAAPAVIS